MKDKNTYYLNQRTTRSLQCVIIFFVFVSTGFFIYSNTFNSPFFLDDVHTIIDNPHIRITELSLEKILKSATGGEIKYRPVAMISFAFNYYFGQYNLAGYHLFNIIIHITTGILLYFFIKTTLTIINHDRRNITLISFFAALIWFVNPLHTNSVTYIVQRMNSMAAMFFILSLLLYAKGRMARIQKSKETKKTHNRRQTQPLKSHYLYFAGCIISGIFAFGCKEIAATLPVFIILYEWYFFRDLETNWLKKHSWRLAVPVIFFAAASILYLSFNPGIIEKILYYNLENNLNNFTPAQRVLTEFRVVVYYIILLILPLPSHLNLDYNFSISRSLITPVTTLFSLLTIAGLMGLALYLAKKNKLISFCIIWFFGNLVIESSVIPLALIFEHRTYLPSMLVPLFIIIISYKYIKQKWLIYVLLCLATMLYAGWTFERNKVWKDEVTLWRDCIKKSPGNARAHANLGNAFFVRGNIEEAIDQSTIALQISPDSANAHLLLACALQAQGKNDTALYHFSRALKEKTTGAVAHNNMGSMMAMQGKIDDAYKHFSEALRYNPDYADAHLNTARILTSQGRFDEAANHYLKALQIEPFNEKIHYSFGTALQKQGKIDEAIFQYTETLKINPDHIDALNNMAWRYATSKNTEFRNGDKAVQLAEHACGLTGHNHPELMDTLAAAYAEAGRFKEARSTIQKAIMLAESASQTKMADDFRKRLELYGSGQPYRESALKYSSEHREGEYDKTQTAEKD